ncbi:MAG: hypothetical protein AB3K77_17205 [Methanosarcinaceae archaeon]
MTAEKSRKVFVPNVNNDLDIREKEFHIEEEKIGILFKMSGKLLVVLHYLVDILRQKENNGWLEIPNSDPYNRNSPSYVVFVPGPQRGPAFP